MRLWEHWKFLVAIYILSAGVWGFLVKLISRRLDWVTLTVLVLVSNALFVTAASFRHVQWTWHPLLPLGILAGLLAAVASLAFYGAISAAPATVVIPLTSQYILVTALLSILFLKEPVNWRILLGIGTGVVSIILLAGGGR